jgi:hypothetical protein
MFNRIELCISLKNFFQANESARCEGLNLFLLVIFHQLIVQYVITFHKQDLNTLHMHFVNLNSTYWKSKGLMDSLDNINTLILFRFNNN